MVKFFSSQQTAQTEGVPPPANAPATVKTADIPVRLGFLRKVYTLLTINLLITVGVSLAFGLIIPVREYIARNYWVLWLSIGVAFAALIVLACVRSVSMKFPMNIIFMFVFVAAFSCMIGVIVSRYYERGYGIVVLQAFVATAAVFLTITAYVYVTKKDFSFLYGFLGAGFIVLLVLIVINFGVVWSTGRVSRGLSFGISIAGALLMTGYLLYDTSMVMTRYGPDDWVPAVISLYVDVTNLFLFLLNIFSFVQS